VERANRDVQVRLLASKFRALSLEKFSSDLLPISRLTVCVQRHLFNACQQHNLRHIKDHGVWYIHLEGIEKLMNGKSMKSRADQCPHEIVFNQVPAQVRTTSTFSTTVISFECPCVSLSMCACVLHVQRMTAIAAMDDTLRQQMTQWVDLN
jgi:hypothetical protein